MPGVICFYYSAPEYLTFLFVWLTLHHLSSGSLGSSSRTSGDAIWAIILMSYVLFFSCQVKPWDSGWSVRVGALDLSRANHNVTCHWCVEVERERRYFSAERVWFWDSWQNLVITWWEPASRIKHNRKWRLKETAELWWCHVAHNPPLPSFPRFSISEAESKPRFPGLVS